MDGDESTLPDRLDAAVGFTLLGILNRGRTEICKEGGVHTVDPSAADINAALAWLKYRAKFGEEAGDAERDVYAKIGTA